MKNENLKLRQNIQRLTEEKKNITLVVKDREEQIRSLTAPPDLSDFTKLVEEIHGYLEDTEEQ
jgi:hypothetical protein